MAKYNIGLTDLLPFLEHLSTNQFIISLPDKLAFKDAINQDVGLYVRHLHDVIDFRQIATASGVRRHVNITNTLFLTQNIRRVHESIIVDHLHFTQTADRLFLFNNVLFFSDHITYDSGKFLPDILTFTQTVKVNHKYSNVLITDTLIFKSNVQIYVIPTRGSQGL